jgi:hypothetical protein
MNYLEDKLNYCRIDCDEVDTLEIHDIFKIYDPHHQDYTLVRYVEFSVKERDNQVIKYFSVNGTTWGYESETTGTRYVYDYVDSILFSKILNWYKLKNRDSKLKKLGI